MRHEEELLHAERIEAAFRNQPSHGTPIPKKGETYHSRSMAGLDGDGVGQGEAYVVGSEPTVTGPFAPSPIQWDIDNLEASLGELVNAFEPVGTAKEIAASLSEGEAGNEQT